MPGTLLQGPGGGVMLPLVWDDFTEFVLANLGLFPGFLGTLDIDGRSSAQLIVGPIPDQVGTKAWFAWAANNPWDLASNPVCIEVVE